MSKPVGNVNSATVKSSRDKALGLLRLIGPYIPGDYDELFVTIAAAALTDEVIDKTLALLQKHGIAGSAAPVALSSLKDNCDVHCKACCEKVALSTEAQLQALMLNLEALRACGCEPCPPCPPCPVPVP